MNETRSLCANAVSRSRSALGSPARAASAATVEIIAVNGCTFLAIDRLVSQVLIPMAAVRTRRMLGTKIESIRCFSFIWLAMHVSGREWVRLSLDRRGEGL